MYDWERHCGNKPKTAEKTQIANQQQPNSNGTNTAQTKLKGKIGKIAKWPNPKLKKASLLFAPLEWIGSIILVIENIILYKAHKK